MRLSFFSSVSDASPKHREMTWQELCQELGQAQTVQNKAYTSCFSPAEFLEGTRRTDEHVIRLHLAVLDIDSISATNLERLNDTLEPYAHAIHTTLSHPKKAHDKPGTWALRVIIPLKTPVEAKDWPRFWRALNDMTHHVMDPTGKNESRLYILPARYPNDPLPILDIHAAALLDPTTLLTSTTPQSREEAPQAAQDTRQGQRVDLNLLRTRIANLRRHTDAPTKVALAANLNALLKGRPYGEPGKRNATMLQLTMELDRIFPAASPDRLAALFAPSHAVMRTEDDAEPDSLELVERAVEGARQMRRERQTQAANDAAHALAERIRDARGDGRDHSYTPEELEHIAYMHGMTPDALRRHWILRGDKQVYFLSIKGYTEGYSQQGVAAVAAHHLSPVPSINLRAPLSSGRSSERRFLSWDVIMGDYGTDISDVVLDLRAPYSRYDPDAKQLRLATAPRRALEPTEHADVHEWLTLLGGDKVERFLAWVACAPDMSKTTCAVYLNGVPGVGKTLFAHGMASLWQRGTPTKFATAIGRFNGDLARCPLVLVDEGFPPLPPKQISTELRSLVGSESVPIEEKFGGMRPLIGPRRLILAANNASLLDFKTELSPQDLEALAVRILQVTPDPKARDVFAKHTRQEIQAWQTHKIAEHALFLQKTLEVPEFPGQRFSVQGELDAMMRHVIIDSYYPSLACQVLVRYITNPKRKHQQDNLIKWGDGELLVNQTGLSAAWDEILTRGPRPPARMASVLRSISTERSRAVKVQGMVRRYWVVDLDVLTAWCEENGYVADEIRAILNAAPSQPETLRVVTA